MTEPFFFSRGRGLSVREIAALASAKPRPGADLDRRITGIAALDQAAPSDLAFLDKAKYAPQLSTSAAGACLTTERFAGRAPAQVSVLCVAEPYRAFVEVARGLFPRSEEHTSELQSLRHLVCRLLLEKKKTKGRTQTHAQIKHKDIKQNI